LKIILVAAAAASAESRENAPLMAKKRRAGPTHAFLTINKNTANNSRLVWMGSKNIFDNSDALISAARIPRSLCARSFYILIAKKNAGAKYKKMLGPDAAQQTFLSGSLSGFCVRSRIE